MKNRFTAIILSVILVSGLAFVPAYGQNLPLTITTDANEYVGGDRVTVSGIASTLFDGAITLQVLAPNGNLVYIDQLSPSSNGAYSASIALNPIWTDGEYVIESQYGSLKAKTSFFIGDSTGSTEINPTLPPLRDNEMRVSDTSEAISFEITGGSINNVLANTADTSLIVTITADDDGELTITIPRNVLDATGTYDDFIVLIDGEEREFEEISTTSLNRVLRIPFLAGDTEIEIIGTFVVPEFGTIAIIVLAIAIISIIGLSFKSRLTIPSSI